jgi:hypothetical protein
MLSEHELQALCDIERRLRWHSPELVRLFNSTWPRPETNQPQRARTRVLMAAAAVVGLMLRGPRMLNEAEAGAQQRPPLARISPPATIAAHRSESASGPAAAAGVAVVDPCVDVMTTRARASCRARARNIAGYPNQAGPHDRTRCRPACSLYRI